MELTTRMLKMLSTVGFLELFEELRKENNTLSNIQCYETLEQEHEKYFKRRRYSSYDSFRKIRERTYHRNY